MVYSTKHSYLILRIGLAVVFFWFGIHKFIHPMYWLDAWVPDWIVSLFAKFGVGGVQFVYLNGVFEVLVGLSLVTGVFARVFCLLGALFLLLVIVFMGINEVSIRDIGLMGGLLAVCFWPERTRS